MKQASKGNSQLVYLVVLIGVVCVAMAAAIFLARPPTPPVSASAFGFDGLARWLTREEVATRRFQGGYGLDPEGIGLRILPLYDDDPNERLVSFVQNNDEDSSLTSDERAHLNAEIVPIPSYVVLRKVETIPTLIVLPKWRDGVRLSGLRHRDFLIDAGAGTPVATLYRTGSPPEPVEDEADPGDSEAGEDEAATESEPVMVGDVEIEITERDSGAQSDAEKREITPLQLPVLAPVVGDLGETQSIALPGELGGGSVRLSVPQYASAGEACEAIVGTQERGLVFACTFLEHEFWVVTDPDLLNSYGLTYAENRAFASTLIETLRGEGEVIVDYTTSSWVFQEPRGRDISDLYRYFQPPFLWLWLAALGLFALAFWRGAVREGPLARIFTEGYAVARRTVFVAQARLMRATGRDGALVRALTRARVAMLADLVLGRDDSRPDRTQRILAFLERRDEALADRFKAYLHNLSSLPDRVPPEMARNALIELETIYTQARALVGVKS